MAPRVSNADVAKHLGISERRVYKMLRDGTCDRSRARQLVVYFGGVEADYLRESRPRGRPRKTGQYTFRHFITSYEDEGTDDAASTLIRQLADFGDDGCLDSLNAAALMTNMLNCRNFNDGDFPVAMNAWKRFRIWQVERECEERIFDIDVMGNLD
jgi:hypothetical protein